MSQRNAHILPIVILNWNSFEDSKECIDSVLDSKSENIKIYLLDNGSEEKDVAAINQSFGNNPMIEIVLNSSNLGFTKAHNQILMRLIKEDYAYIFLLNNDTAVEKGSINLLTKHLKEGKLDILTCKMVNYQNRNLMDNAGHKIMSSGEIIPIGHGESVSNFNTPFENFGSCAGACLYSTKMLKNIGLFDDYFETGYEDAELGFRAIVAGYQSLYDPQIVVYHKMGQSIKKIFDYNYTLKIQSNIFYSYLKLTHWQVIAINFIPWFLRFIIITFIDILFLRIKYLKIQYHSLYIIFMHDFKKLLKSRKESKSLRKISWLKLLEKQEFFLVRDIESFYKFIIKGEKSHFEKY